MQADESAGSWGNSHFFLGLLGFQVLKMKGTAMGSMIAKTDAYLYTLMLIREDGRVKTSICAHALRKRWGGGKNHGRPFLSSLTLVITDLFNEVHQF